MHFVFVSFRFRAWPRIKVLWCQILGPDRSFIWKCRTVVVFGQAHRGIGCRPTCTVSNCLDIFLWCFIFLIALYIFRTFIIFLLQVFIKEKDEKKKKKNLFKKYCNYLLILSNCSHLVNRCQGQVSFVAMLQVQFTVHWKNNLDFPHSWTRNTHKINLHSFVVIFTRRIYYWLLSIWRQKTTWDAAQFFIKKRTRKILKI